MEFPDDVKKTVSFAQPGSEDFDVSPQCQSSPVACLTPSGYGRRTGVKNTFITVEAEEDEQPTMSVRSISGPARFKQAEIEAEEERERFAKDRENDPELEGLPLSRDQGRLPCDRQAPIAPISSKAGSRNIGETEATSEEKAPAEQLKGDDDGEQPTMLRNLSGPLTRQTADEPMRIPVNNNREDPLRIPFNSDREELWEEKGPAEREKRQTSLTLTVPPSTHAQEMDAKLPTVEEDRTPHFQIHTTQRVKNTFLHYEPDEDEDDEAQPSITKRAVSDNLHRRRERRSSDEEYLGGIGQQLSQNAQVPPPLQRTKSPAGPVGKPAKVPFQGDEDPQAPQRNGDLEARGSSDRTQAAHSHWSYKESTYPPGMMLPGPAGIHPPPGMAPGMPPAQSGLPPRAFMPPTFPPPGMNAMNSAYGVPAFGAPWMGMPPPGYHMPPLGYHMPMSQPSSGKGNRRSKSPAVPEDGDSPYNTYFGVPKKDPFGFGEPEKPTFRKIPDGEEPPSRGSYFHNELAGQLFFDTDQRDKRHQPCAHSWKPKGCANGKDCEFCHACLEEDFKRSKKDKITRLREKGVPRKRAQKGEGGDEKEQQIEQEEETKDAGSFPAQDPIDTELEKNIIEVSYQDSPVAWRLASVRWLANLKREAVGKLTRKFDLKVGDHEVPFMFMLTPRDASSSKDAIPRNIAANKKTKLEATLQMKCMKEELPADFAPMRVTFRVGEQPERVAADEHDFKNMAVLAPQDAVWDLMIGDEANPRCIVRAELSPISAAS